MKMSVRRFIGVVIVLIGVVALFQYQFGGNGGKSVEYDQTWNFEASELHELIIDSDSMGLDVKFVKSTDDTNSVRIAGQAKEDIVDKVKRTDLEDGQLNIDLNGKWHIGFFNFSDFRSSDQTVTVTLTDEAVKALETLNLSSDSGSLKVADAVAVNGSVHSDSGSIKIEGYQGDALSVKSDSGSIKVDDLEGSTLSLRADSGSIRLANARAALTASSDSGSITIEHLSGKADVQSDSGSIRLDKDDDTGADVESDSGSVKITVPASYGGTYDLKSDSGSIHEPDQRGTSSEVIKVRTDSGSIRVDRE